jgi:hypothetical protein
MSIGEEELPVRNTIEWNDSLLIFEHWETKPNWKQIRQSFCKSIWYNKPNWLRTLKITEILNG